MTITAPDVLPLLSRGKHRNPRKGACLMEMASLLAGERWSDHPACVHPLLASLGRLVNDNTSDPERQQLNRLLPSMIGLTSDDPGWDAVIARRAAAAALPVAAEHRQRVLAVGLLACRRHLAALGWRDPAPERDVTEAALAHAPVAAGWAQRFSLGHDASPDHFRSRSAPSIVLTAVAGIVESCAADRDERLRQLLVAAVDDCTALGRSVDVPSPVAALAMTMS